MAERSPRERCVYEAAQSLREHGVHGTSLRDVVARAGAPRGSLQHYFPDGKAQVVSEAVRWSAAFAAAAVERYVSTEEPTPGGLLTAMVDQWRTEFTRRGYERGCPLVAAAADVAGADAVLRSEIDAGFDRWTAAVRDALVRCGVAASRAAPLAVLVISALEGAIVLARTRRSLAPLDTVARELGPLLDAEGT